MFSLKRIIFIILAIVAIGALFFAANFFLGNSAASKGSHDSSEQREFFEARSIENGDKPTVLILGNENGEPLADVHANVKQTCEDLQLPLASSETAEGLDLGSFSLMIVCDPSISTRVSREALESFLASGGNVIMASGISSAPEDADFLPLLGIESISGMDDYHDLSFEAPLLPLQPEEARYNGESNSAVMGLASDATIYVQAESDDNPLMYQIGAKGDDAGSIFVINGSFLSDSGNRGLLTGAIGAAMPDFIYPVFGTKTVFLDNFPAITDENDALCSRLYGYSTQRFVESTIWPAFQGMSLRSDTSYSASLLVEASSDSEFESSGTEIFIKTGKTMLQFDNELMFASDCTDPQSIVFDEGALDQFAESFPSYTVRSLAVEGDAVAQEMLDIPGAEISCVRESASSTSIPLSWQNERAVFPAATKGNDLRSGEMLSIYSIIGAYGLVSHAFDLNAMISADGTTASWENDRWEIGAFESDILSQAPWLEDRTLSQVKQDVQSYRTMRYGWTRDGNQIEIQCSSAVVGQAFLYHTREVISGVEGLSYDDLGNGFYMLHLENSTATIQLEEGA